MSKPNIFITKEVPLIIYNTSGQKDYGTVILCPGGYIEIRSSITLNIDELVRSDDFKSLPATHPYSSMYDLIITGKNGNHGKDGDRGDDGENGNDGKTGGDASDATDGERGKNGFDGDDAPMVNINIVDLKTDLSVLNIGGAGGNGGNGGCGGNGGNGGNGSSGCGGKGGAGGNGGDGGNGGKGGDGGKAVITYQSSNQSQIFANDKTSSGGKGGDGGKQGKNGKGGSGGDKCTSPSQNNNEKPKQGDSGSKGPDGQQGYTQINTNLVTNGSVKLDYTNPLHAQFFLNRFGGEENLKNNYPQIYKAFLKSKEKQLKSKSQSTDSTTSSKYDMKEETFRLSAIGLADEHVKSSSANNSIINKILNNTTYLHRATPSPMVILTGEMKDITSPDSDKQIIYDSYFVYYKNKNITHSEEKLNHPVRDVISIKDKKIQCSAVCDITNPDGTIETHVSDLKTYTLDGLQGIDSFEVKAPYSPRNNNPLIVLYDRNPDSGEISDYSYGSDKVNAGTDKVNVYLPISGAIVCSQDFVFKGFSKSDTLKPQLMYNNDGIAEYNYTTDEIKAHFRLDKQNPRKITFEYNENWKSVINKSNYDARLEVGLNCSFYLDIEEPISQKTWSIPFSINSVTQAPEEGYYNSNSPSVKIPNIKIKWGCFAKNTQILMADGKTKQIDAITKGDKVLSDKGNVLEVKGTLKGTEKELVYIRTENGKEIMVSKTHPVACKRGIISAERLNASDILCLQNDQYSPIKDLYLKDYNNEVYNIDTGGKDLIIANGIVCGNYESQNTNYNTDADNSENMKLSTEVQSLIDEMERFCKSKK